MFSKKLKYRCVVVWSLSSIVCLHFWLPTTTVRAQDIKADQVQTYKKVGDIELKMHIFEPPRTTKRTGAAVVFFFGGGWVGGSPSQFFPQCRYLASRGMVAMSAEYRVRSKHNTTPFECVRDGKSAVRWVRFHAAEFDVDPSKIVAAGGSAGGHVAACTALIKGMEDPTTDGAAAERAGPTPSALVLFNPVIDTSELGFGYKRLGDRYAEVSPLEHVRPGLPPTLIMQGNADTTTPASGHREFERRMTKHGNRCRLILYPGQKHGFFNPGRGDGTGFKNTTAAMTEFLEALGYLTR